MKADVGYYFKDTIKTILVSKANQKIRFQIRHPENALRIVGIAVTCNAHQQSNLDKIKGNVAGYLSLAIAEKGDVAFGEDVKIEPIKYCELLENNIFSQLSSSFSINGKQQSYFETNYKITHAILEAYYEDVFLSNLLFNTSGVNVSITSTSVYPFNPNSTEIIIPVIEPIADDRKRFYYIKIYLKYEFKK